MQYWKFWRFATYNDVGNRLHSFIENTPTPYGSDNTILLIGFQYDAAGRLVSDGTHQFTYNGLDQVVEMTTGSGAWRFASDAFERRIAKRKVNASGTPVPDTFTRFLYEGRTSSRRSTETRGRSWRRSPRGRAGTTTWRSRMGRQGAR